jgi:hypothetical protein
MQRKARELVPRLNHHDLWVPSLRSVRGQEEYAIVSVRIPRRRARAFDQGTDRGFRRIPYSMVGGGLNEGNERTNGEQESASTKSIELHVSNGNIHDTLSSIRECWWRRLPLPSHPSHMGSTCKRRADRKSVFLTLRKEAFLIFLFLFEHILGLVSFSGCVQVSPLEGSRRKAADGGGDGFRSGGWEWHGRCRWCPISVRVRNSRRLPW